MTRSVVPLILLYVLLLWPAALIEAAEGTKPVEVYEPPVLLTRVNPVYPRSAQVKGEEAWVDLQFMVGTDGRPYEVAVADSMGAEEFSEIAAKVVERWVYQAGRMNGQPLDAAVRIHLMFSLDRGKSGARSLFSQQFKSIKKHIEKNERAAALELLGKADARNHFEEVFLQIGWYHFHVRWGTPEQQRVALTRATASGPDVRHVPLDFIQMIMLARFGAEVRTNHFGAALNTAKVLNELQEAGTVKLEADRLRSLGEMADKIKALKKDDTTFVVDGAIGEHSNWVYTLLKDEMTFHVLDGEIAELKLRCERRYVGFRFAADSIFKIPESYGNCELEVIGNPGTTFTLTQS